MLEKIDVLMPVRSQYHALHNFSEKIYEAFCRLGFTCRLVDAEDHFTIPVKDPPDLTFGINGVPFDEDRRMLCDIIDVPHVSYTIDPPFHFFEILSSPRVLVACDDQYDCTFLNQMGFHHTFFMPHGVDRDLSFDMEQERDIDILLLASYIDYEKLRQEWRQVLPKIVSQVMDDAIDITFSDDKTSFMEAFNIAYQERLGLKEEPKNMGQDFVLPLILLEKYVKGKERVDLVKSIKDAQVTIFNGRQENEVGWEKVLGEGCENVTLLDPVDYEQGLQAMKRTKIVLNSFIKNKQGTHDRVLNAFACGALPLTNENRFMNQFFEDEENILFFYPGRLDEVNEKVCRYLEDEEKRKELATKGREIVMAGHTWDHRVKTLLDALLQS